ncbi:LPS-assembly protein LptD [Horticoccus sp. 23ND18S-11]|uniref:LPS-assembly protein LptD n=1 Tax=Horticoccus sp. 23ND18S-11 TaxID=3391832 RepID=UPI0039C95F1D
MIRRIVLLFALVGAVIARGAETPPDLSADSLETLVVDGRRIALATGNARLISPTFLLTADEIRYDLAGEAVTAAGHIVFTRGEARLLADRLSYKRSDGSFKAENIRLGSFPYFAEGFSAEGTASEITVRGARVSYGEPGPWQPTLTADMVVIAPGQRIRTEKATAGVGQVQPLPFPKFQYDLAKPFAGAVSLNGGYRRSLGVFAEAGLLVPVAQAARVGADLGLYTERGVMIGPAMRYTSTGSDDRLKGQLRSGYINDHGDKKTDLLGRPVPEDRAYAEWKHQQMLAPNLSLNAQLNWWRDSEVLRDFRPRAFFPVQEPDTFVESVYNGENYFVSAFMRFQPNRFHRVQERLPEIRFDYLPIAIGNGFYERFNASAAVLREDPLITGTALRSTRLDAYYALSRPIAPREWLAFTPVAGARVTHYTDTDGAATPSGAYTRVLGEVGADVALRASGTFDYKNPRWKIDGLRHLVTPRLSYRYIPEAAKGRARIPQIDREVFSTYLQPLGLGEVRNLDDLHATNTLRLGLDNIIQTRDPVLGSRDLLVFNVANDFRFKRRPGERDVSEIHTELALMPAHWLQVDVYQSFAPQSFTLREFNSGVTLRDGTVWSVRFGNNFLRQQIQDFSVDGRLRLTERFEALTRLRYDARKRRFNEQAYGVAQNINNTWLIAYTVSLYSGRSRESSFGFNVEVSSIGF